MKQRAARNSRPEQVTTIAPAPSGAGADILVLTEDDFFLLAVRRVVTLPNRVWHATSDSQAVDMLMSKPCAVVLVDVALVRSDLEAVVTRLRQQLPELGFVIAGGPADERQVEDLVDSGAVQGFVKKSEVTANLAPVLEAGINRHLELRIETARRTRQPVWKRPAVLAALIGGAVAVAAAAAWLLLREDAASPAADTGQTTTLMRPAGEAVSVVDTQLQKARDAFGAGRYVEPKGDNALDYYKAAIAADGSNAEARDGLHRIAEVMLARAEAAMLETQTREAQAALRIAKSVEPAHPRVAFLEAQLSRELERTAAAQQEAARADAQNQRFSNFMRLGNERLGQDRLLEPANDSARHYFAAARELDSGSVLVLQGMRALGNKLVQKSSQAAARGDLDDAEQFLAQAKQLGVNGVDYAKAERDMRSAQRAKSGEPERLIGLVRERLGQGRLLEPDKDSARHYAVQLRQQFPDHAGVGSAVDSVRTQLIEQAVQAAGRMDVKTGQTYIDEARGLGASGAAFDSALAEVTSARRRAEALAKILPVRDSMVVKSHTPEYPIRAQRSKVEGQVELNFTVTTTGEVKDAVVVRAEPADTFDDAALRSIRRWKFKPKEVEGELVEQRLSLRMRFQLTEE